MKSYVNRNDIVRECTVDTPFTTAVIHMQPVLSEDIVIWRISAELREMDCPLMWMYSLSWFSEVQGAELVLRIYYLHYKRCHKAH